MAQLAAQDYFTRLQASGLSAFPHPDLAAAFPSALAMGGVNSAGISSSQSSSGNNRQNSGESKGKSRKEKKTASNNSASNYNASNSGGGGNAIGQNTNAGGSHSISSPLLPSASPSSYKVNTPTTTTFCVFDKRKGPNSYVSFDLRQFHKHVNAIVISTFGAVDRDDSADADTLLIDSSV